MGRSDSHSRDESNARHVVQLKYAYACVTRSEIHKCVQVGRRRKSIRAALISVSKNIKCTLVCVCVCLTCPCGEPQEGRRLSDDLCMMWFQE